jgi:hypothetical protein
LTPKRGFRQDGLAKRHSGAPTQLPLRPSRLARRESHRDASYGVSLVPDAHGD